MRYLVRRLVAVLVCAATAVWVMPAPAQAGTGCSTTKQVPGISVSYYYCDHVEGARAWSDDAVIRNAHGADARLESQVNLRVDGKDNILTPWQFTAYGSPTTALTTHAHPYDRVYDGAVDPDSCTPGHSYFPIVRMRSYPSGAWGAWAGAGNFICPS